MADGTVPTLRMIPPPADLADLIVGFVHRDDAEAGGVVRYLPDVRGAIQVMLQDPVWTRSAGDGAVWTRVPAVGLWGPRHSWCYGFAARHIRAWSVGLTYAGLRAVSGQPAPGLIDRILPLAETRPALAEVLAPAADETFDRWRERAVEAFRHSLDAGPTVRLTAAMDILATSDGNAVALAAEAAGLSERQFRRVFRDLHGVSPKRYQRALRVDRMIRQLHDDPWEGDPFGDAPIPFADQPHAIREFRAMTGISPGAYVRAKRGGGRVLRSVPVTGVAGPVAIPV